VLDQLSAGVAVIDASLRIATSNRALDLRVQSHDGATLRDGALALTDPEAQTQLVSRMKRCAEEDSDVAKFAVRVRRGSSRPDLHILVTRLRNRQWCIWVFDPLGSRDLSAKLLRDLHGLTEAESKVATALFTGRSTKEAAAVLGISVNTVKAHLKGIFRKCAVRSQAELSQLLALGCWSL
jgi:DNA-binding CsgD family transcriptional regulator